MHQSGTPVWAILSPQELVWRFALSARVIAGKVQHLQVQSAARRTSARWRAHALTPGTQENTKTLSRRGILRDVSVLVMPDSHGHPPGASAAVWAPDAREASGMRGGARC